MLELKGKYCKDCKVFNDEVEEEALATIYNILDIKEYKEFDNKNNLLKATD